MGKNKQLRRDQNRKVQSEGLLQTLMECQKKMEVIQDQISKISTKITSLRRISRVSDISISYLRQDAGLEGGKYYKQLGRSFFQESLETVLVNLNDSKSESERDLPKLQSTLAQFEKLRAEQDKAIQELTENLKHSTS